MPLFGSLKANKSLMHLITTMSFCSYEMLSSTNYLPVNNFTLLYICSSELPSSSFIIENVYQVCHLPITVCFIEVLWPPVLQPSTTIVSISSFHSFCQILMLLVACVRSIPCLAQSQVYQNTINYTTNIQTMVLQYNWFWGYHTRHNIFLGENWPLPFLKKQFSVLSHFPN